MIELLGLIFGGAFRLLPEVLGMFKAKRDAEHEFRMTELQLKIDEARAKHALDLAHAQAEIAAAAGEMNAWAEAIRAQSQPSGIGWIDALSSSVRPILTYWWVIVLYSGAKVLQIGIGIDAGAGLADFVPILVTEFDRTVIGSILSFWFVDRSLRRGAGK
jgi:hypothetical protein